MSRTRVWPRGCTDRIAGSAAASVGAPAIIRPPTSQCGAPSEFGRLQCPRKTKPLPPDQVLTRRFQLGYGFLRFRALGVAFRVLAIMEMPLTPEALWGQALGPQPPPALAAR